MAHVRTGNVARDVESRHNRDIGAAAATTDGLDALGRLSAVKGSDSGSLEPDTGAGLGLGVVERRKATPEELARLDEPEPVKATAETRTGPAMHLIRPAAAAMAERRARGAARHVEVMAERRADPAKEEEPMVTATSLEVPCGTCLHEPVCAIKARIPASAGEPIAVQLAPGLRQYVQGFRIGVVLDPFAGTGTTAEVANGLLRRAVLIELDPAAIGMIRRRCEARPIVSVPA